MCLAEGCTRHADVWLLPCSQSIKRAHDSVEPGRLQVGVLHPSASPVASDLPVARAGALHVAYACMLALGVLAEIKGAYGQVTSGELLHANANRSPTAYLANPPEERARYAHSTDKTMSLLKLLDAQGRCALLCLQLARFCGSQHLVALLHVNSLHVLRSRIISAKAVSCVPQTSNLHDSSKRCKQLLEDYGVLAADTGSIHTHI